MKKHLFYLFLGLVLFGFAACSDKDESVATPQVIQDLDKRLERYNADKLAQDHAQYYKGHIRLVQNADKELMVLTDQQIANGQYRYFFLQSEEQLALPTENRFEAELIFLGKDLIVNARQLPYTLHLGLGEEPLHEAFGDLSFSHRFEGFGLGYNQSTQNLAETNLLKNGGGNPTGEIGQGTCKCRSSIPESEINDSDCSSGGRYAQSCSCCGCSVTCRGSSYACCKAG